MRLIFILSTLLIFGYPNLRAQVQDIVVHQGISSAFHESNKGRILFTGKAIAPDELKAGDLLSSYVLTNKSDLYMTVFLENSATNYLHRLAPNLSADSLNKAGNYQFNFYIDGRLIHQSNIYPGAPRAAAQDTATIISKPLIDNRNEGALWSQSLWNRFQHYGGDSALTEGSHLLRIELKTYLKQGDQILNGDLIAAGDLRLLVRRKPMINIASIKLNPVKPYGGIAVSKEAFDVAKIRELKGNITEAVFKNINAVVVLKNGALLIEEYFNGENRNSLHDPRSVGKSFASTLIGIAKGEGYLHSEEQQLREFYDLHAFSNYSPKKDSTRIKDLLTMSSAFDGNDDDGLSPGNEENMYPTDNWVRFALDLPVSTTIPSGQWHYFTAGVIVLGDILEKRVPGGLEKYADEKLFAPLHIRDYKWPYTPQHVPGTAGGIRLRALDFAKYGQLYKNGGSWNGRQLIPSEWVERSFTKQKSIPEREGEYYGYLFWNKTYRVKGKDYEVWYCSGNGGNKIFVFKELPIVVVITASAYGTAYAHRQVDRMMEEFILPSVIDRQK